MTPTYKSIRFNHPDLDRGAGTPGLTLNLRGSLATVEGAASVRQAILLLISTRPGERIMRPRYGCNLHRLLFSPNDHTTAGLAIHYVRQALLQWEPRIDILHLDANASFDAPSQLEIFLEYRVRSTLQTEALSYRLELMGDQI